MILASLKAAGQVHRPNAVSLLRRQSFQTARLNSLQVMTVCNLGHPFYLVRVDTDDRLVTSRVSVSSAAASRICSRRTGSPPSGWLMSNDAAVARPGDGPPHVLRWGRRASGMVQIWMFCAWSTGHL